MIAFVHRLLLGSNSQSEIPPVFKSVKEGQDSNDDDDDSRRKAKKKQLEILNEENRKLYEGINRLHQQYDKLLENASSDYEEILIYEVFVRDLSDIITKLIIHLDCKDRKIASLLQNDDRSEENNNLSATTDLKVVVEGKCKEKKEQTAIIDKLNIKMSDNTINKTNDLNDLRHQQQQQHQKYKTYNDLQSTCQKQSPPQLEANTKQQDLKIMNESIVKEKHTNSQKEEGGNLIEAIDQDNDKCENCVKLEARNKKLELKCRKSKENIEHIKKCNINDDTKALIFEIADKHDHIANLRSKMNKLEEKVEQLERKVQFREKIIRELRRSTKNQQDSTVGKSMSEVNFDCYDDVNKEEIERLHQNVYEIESENSCNRLLITKLEDELVMIRKCEARNKQDRNLKTDKLNVLKHKIHVVATKLLGKNSNSENVKELKLHNNDLALIEDELKPEIDVLNSVVKLVNTTRTNLEQISNENNHMIDALKAKLLESSQNNQILTTEIMRLSSAQLSDDQINKKNNCCNNDKRATECIITRNTNDSLNNKKNITPFGKVSEEPPTSSSPEISSGNSSLSNGHSSLSDVINEWKQELEEKKCELRHKNATINDLQERLQEKEEKICEAQNDFKSIQIERDKYCQMVAQLKQAIQFHNDSIQYLKRQNAELKEEMDMTKGKLTNHQDSYDEIKKRNIALEGENNNLHITITSMRTTIEELKRGNSVSGNKSFRLKRFWKTNA